MGGTVLASLCVSRPLRPQSVGLCRPKIQFFFRNVRVTVSSAHRISFLFAR